MQDNKYSWTTGYCLRENIWSENSALRAKVEALEKEVSRLRAEKAVYYGIVTELVADSAAVNTLLEARVAELQQQYRSAGVSLDARLRGRQRLWMNLLSHISKNATTLQQWIYQDMGWDGTMKVTVYVSQPRTFLGTGLG